MERKVKEEQRIEQEKNEMFHLLMKHMKETPGNSQLRAIESAMQEYSEKRNKEDAIGFVFWYLENSDKYPGSYTTPQLYEIYINQKV